jgi:hypothetical protein
LAEGGIRQCRFANNVRTRSAGAEVISQFHPFVRFISEELQKNRAESIDLISVAVSGSAKGGERLRPGQFAFSVQRWTFNGLRTEEAIRARVVDVNSLKVLSPEESLGIVNSARMFGLDWPEATAALDHQSAANALEECELELVTDFGNEKMQKDAENADRVQFQLQSIKAYRDRKLATERQRIANLGDEPRSRGLVRASEKTIERLRERFGIQEAKLAATLRIDSHRETVGRGVINVEGEAFS